MRFIDLNDCLRFVRESNIEQLENIIKDDFCLYEFLDNKEDVNVKSDLIVECQQKLKGTKIEDEFWSDALRFIDNEYLTDEVINYFFKNNIAIMSLGHLPLKDKFLWCLVDYVEESILTLGIRYFTEDKYSAEEFRNFLLRFSRVDWLWNRLISTGSNNLRKRKSTYEE